ncbi:integrase, catalytic region, zinc finger, CCHC-type containing protein [Tanacetum coccineum]|uniref:Integrase, catalytic region, zinc finger, CCHC-type containing protein n=1 Tax=Tanacetum coccineum TaxID=301880 RepID=A0ABQ4X7I5_9ASTR
MVDDLRYFNSLENEVDTLKSQLETQETQFLNEIDRLSREYYYANHMKAILGVYTDLVALLFANVISSRKLGKLTRQPMAVPISTREPKQNVNQSVATSSKKTVATDSTVKKSRNITRKLYEQVSKTCSWWYPKYTPSGYNWKPKTQKGNVNPNLVEIILFIVDSGCSKHMTGNLKLLTNFVEKFLGTVKFGNDQIAPILGYGDLVQGTITIKRVYYVEGLNHNLFSVGQFCDADLEVAFRKSTCYIRDLKGNDLLTGSRGTDLYSISLQDSTTPNPICLMAKATSSQAWLWHQIGIRHETSTARTPEQNGVVERQNRTLVEAARTMLSAAKVPLFLLAEADGKQHVLLKKTDGENLDKMKEKGDACIFVGYSTQSKAYRVFNKRTRMIVETIHVNFDELPQMASDHVSSDPGPQCSTTVLEQDSLSPGPQSQENVPQVAETVTTSNELELLYSPMFSELLNGNYPVVSKFFRCTCDEIPINVNNITQLTLLQQPMLQIHLH